MSGASGPSLHRTQPKVQQDPSLMILITIYLLKHLLERGVQFVVDTGVLMVLYQTYQMKDQCAGHVGWLKPIVLFVLH
ncbi:hypothetical protein ACFX15_031294 [Malus domestica]